MGITKEQREQIKKYVIYCLYCKNEDVKDIYIGSTDSLNKRMIKHKSECNKSNQQKIYKIIRENGGWENWTYDILENMECNDLEARQREEYHRKRLEANMNSQRAFQTQEEKIEQNREKGQKWYENNQERAKENNKNWKMKNKERVKEKNKIWYEKNKHKKKRVVKNGKKKIKILLNINIEKHDFK